MIKLGGTHFNFWRFTIQKSSIDHSRKLLNHSFILHISCLKCNILAIGISTISTHINKPSNYTSHFLHLSGCKLAIKMTKVTWSGLLIWQSRKHAISWTHFNVIFVQLYNRPFFVVSTVYLQLYISLHTDILIYAKVNLHFHGLLSNFNTM